MNKNKWCKWFFWFLEKCGPCILGTIGAALAIWLVLICKLSQEAFDKVLESTITLSSILIGFIGALLGILFTVKNTETISLLFQSKEKIVLKRYFRYNVILGMFLVVFSLLLYVIEAVENLTETIQYIVYGLWGFLLLYTLSSTFRIINIMMHIIFDEKPNENKEPEPVKMDDKEKTELKKQYKR